MHICPLGGLGEVGKNITLYECQGDMILVDCGLVFPDSDMFGVDLVIPDFTYVLENKDRIKGLFITHGHEDHIGSLPYLLKKFNVPIYTARLTIGLIKNKLEEHGLASSAEFHEIRPRQKVRLGCFTVEPIHVNHSIPDSLAFAIDCPAGTVLHTGFTDPDNRRTYPWGREDYQMIDFHRVMIRIHKKYEVLKTGSLGFLWNDYQGLCYARFSHDEQIIVIVNNQEEGREVEIRLEQAGISRLEDTKLKRVVMTSAVGFTEECKEYTAAAGILKITMPAFGAVVLHHKN